MDQGQGINSGTGANKTAGGCDDSVCVVTNYSGLQEAELLQTKDSSWKSVTGNHLFVDYSILIDRVTAYRRNPAERKLMI